MHIHLLSVRPRNREERKNRNPPTAVLKRWAKEAKRQRDREQFQVNRGGRFRGRGRGGFGNRGGRGRGGFGGGRGAATFTGFGEGIPEINLEQSEETKLMMIKLFLLQSLILALLFYSLL